MQVRVDDLVKFRDGDLIRIGTVRYVTTYDRVNISFVKSDGEKILGSFPRERIIEIIGG